MTIRYVDDGLIEALRIVRREYDDAERKAWDALGRYKFEMFGYWASKVVSYGQLLAKMGGAQPANPFRGLVTAARQEQTNRRVAGAPGYEAKA